MSYRVEPKRDILLKANEIYFIFENGEIIRLKKETVKGNLGECEQIL